jgi:hypothetical protein
LSQGKSGLLESQGALQKACGSDITIAPVTLDYFKEQFKSVQTSTGRRFVMASLTAPVFNLEDAQPVTVAVVQILQPIETSLSVVLPGEYRLDYWFDANEVFYAATISGITSNGNIVTNQPVPAVPAAFINDPEHADLPEESGAQISASRIFGRCTFFQKSCT